MGKLMRLSKVILFSAAFFSMSAYAAGGGAALEDAEIDPGNINSLQRGAANFMNYCSGCHSAKYVRYKTIGKSLDLSEEQLVENLMFNAEKTFETINVSMREEDGARWFGTTPPDLSLMARSKGSDYIYTFLKSFYVDPESPTGVDNVVLEGTSMPHVLWELQGFQRAVFTTEEHADGSKSKHFGGFEPVTTGSRGEEDYEDFVRDTTNFLAYIAEPMRSERRKLGVWVLIFLGFFYIVAKMLKNQIWKDVK